MCYLYTSRPFCHFLFNEKRARFKSGQSRGPKVGVSNERFSAKVKLRCKLDIHTALLSPPVTSVVEQDYSVSRG